MDYAAQSLCPISLWTDRVFESLGDVDPVRAVVAVPELGVDHGSRNSRKGWGLPPRLPEAKAFMSIVKVESHSPGVPPLDATRAVSSHALMQTKPPCPSAKAGRRLPLFV